MTISAQDELFSSTEGYFVTKALLASWRLGVLDHAAAAGQIDVGDYAAEVGYDPALLRALLGYLVVRGFFDVTGDTYRLSDKGKAVAPYFGYLPMHVGAYEPVLGAIEDVIRGDRTYGEGLKRSETEMLGGMTALEDHVLGRLAGMLGGKGFTRALDLGCGSARLLSRLLTRNPHATGIGIDWEQDAVDDAQRTLADAGLTKRATVLRGDAARIGDLAPDVLGKVDLVLAMFVMHEIYRQRSAAGVIECLTHISNAIGDDGRLLLVEVSRIELTAARPALRFIPEYQLIHEFSNQRLASQDDWRGMLAQAGLAVLSVEPAGMCEAFCFVTGRA